MKQFLAFMLFAAFAGLVFWCWVRYRHWAERQRSSEERFASFIGQARPQAEVAAEPSAADASLSQQKLLLEAAAKAGEAGEAVLSIQLYARLISRYPDSAFGAQARAAVEAQKKKLAKR